MLLDSHSIANFHYLFVQTFVFASLIDKIRQKVSLSRGLRMSKKLQITSRGKVVIVIGVVIALIAGGVGMRTLTSSASDSNADQVYAYSMITMLDAAKENENNVREELRQDIEKANTLLNDTNGKIFDSTRTDFQVYVNNIIEVPDSQIIESDNIIDYVNSETKIRSFITNLSGKRESLQTSYDSWKEIRNELDESTGEAQEAITEDISEAEKKAKTIQDNINELERKAEEREKEIQAAKDRINQNKPKPAPTPAPKPTVAPAPVNPSPTPKPTTPESPAPTTKPAPPVKPTPTEKPTTPTPPPEEDEDVDTSMIGQNNG